MKLYAIKLTGKCFFATFSGSSRKPQVLKTIEDVVKTVELYKVSAVNLKDHDSKLTVIEFDSSLEGELEDMSELDHDDPIFAKDSGLKFSFTPYLEWLENINKPSHKLVIGNWYIFSCDKIVVGQLIDKDKDFFYVGNPAWILEAGYMHKFSADPQSCTKAYSMGPSCMLSTITPNMMIIPYTNNPRRIETKGYEGK